MTREKAEDLVFDLLQAQQDADQFSYRRSYQEDLRGLRELVINHLTAEERDARTKEA